MVYSVLYKCDALLPFPMLMHELLYIAMVLLNSPSIINNRNTNLASWDVGSFIFQPGTSLHPLQ